ncbi:MAG: hypothetical protein A3J62_00605 [Candidatus Buchananbacteria bacterium RIFCSPHIGHO2_02_FULL_38_8]|uniref:Uncharacterized protein n=2 Tax=Candidatus Buchananiibacteriota TaxID=1817903 RepID=A0A1G1Y1V3_9BACT|nr:MAG: hypothetical protein A2731_01100 [Candidatus Buchananbacteria bacterium RIFCSPHIGHO2_01_FULL_39_8]OGY47265.1 MAG: hypothetical protein A3J62_00605 [Candidatus Buchananbacteria bacterium RIFCSPHIGHO2_02_FULL_38_8]
MVLIADNDKVRRPLKPPIKTAIPHKTFRLIFNRPRTALNVPVKARIEQLREIFHEATRLFEGYIIADIILCPNNIERFCITFTTAPEHRLADANIRQVVDRLTPELVKEIVVDGTGIDPRRIEVEQKE